MDEPISLWSVLVSESQIYLLLEAILVLAAVVMLVLQFVPSRRVSALDALVKIGAASFLLGVGAAGFHLTIPFMRLASGVGAEPSRFAMEVIVIAVPLWVSSFIAFACLLPPVMWATIQAVTGGKERQP